MRLDHTPEPSAYRPRSHRDHANISRSVIGQFKGSAQESPPRENELWQAPLRVGQSAELTGGADPRKGSALIGPSYRLTKTEPLSVDRSIERQFRDEELCIDRRMGQLAQAPLRRRCCTHDERCNSRCDWLLRRKYRGGERA